MLQKCEFQNRNALQYRTLSCKEQFPYHSMFRNVSVDPLWILDFKFQRRRIQVSLSNPPRQDTAT